MLEEQNKRQKPGSPRNGTGVPMQGVENRSIPSADPSGMVLAALSRQATSRPRPILTTLYDLVEAVWASVDTDDEDLVLLTIASILRSSRITFLRLVAPPQE